MSILSIRFYIFLLLLAGLYYAVPQRLRPGILLLGNLAFYLSYDVRASLFLLFSILSTFYGALALEKREQRRGRRLLGLILSGNIGLLAFVKYGPWLWSLARPEGPVLKLLVPLGISFYTLQAAGYLLDVYRKKYPAERSLLRYGLFVSFFPLILQGPISRYDWLGPQLSPEFSPGPAGQNISEGAGWMLWGSFKKLVIAEYAAVAVGSFYGNYTAFGFWATAAAVFCYTIQIYADFSGCVDICRGAARLFGIRLMENFDHPYFSRSVREFWRRWHISLSSWLRDYLYIPLGGSRRGRKYANILLVFLVSGLWHGVGLHFIVWGLLHGAVQAAEDLCRPLGEKLCRRLKLRREGALVQGLQLLLTFLFINISWVFFRAPDLGTAFGVLVGLLGPWKGLSELLLLGLTKLEWLVLLLSVLLLFTVSVLESRAGDLRQKLDKKPLVLRWSVYLLGFLLVLVLGKYGPGYSASSFIYMNF